MKGNRDGADQILNVAINLFSTHGYDGVSTTQLAKAVGLSQPNLHYHYGSKLGLWKAAIQEMMRRMDARSTLDLDALRAMPPVDALKEMFNPSFFVIQANLPEWGRFMQLEGLAGGERLEYIVEQVVSQSYALYVEFIEAGIKDRSIKAYRPEQIMFFMHGALVNYFNLAPLVDMTFGSSPYDLKNAEDYFEMYMDIMFSGLVTGKAGSKG